MKAKKDWTLAEAALSALPHGTWTTFGDVARLERTSAQSVASWVSSAKPNRRAYRILNRDGMVPKGFRWNVANAGEWRDPVNVLGADGVRVGLDGRADPSQRLGADQLRRLADAALVAPLDVSAS